MSKHSIDVQETKTKKLEVKSMNDERFVDVIHYYKLSNSLMRNMIEHNY